MHRLSDEVGRAGAYLGDSLGDLFVTTTKLFKILASAIASISDTANFGLQESQPLLHLVEIGIQVTILVSYLISFPFDLLDTLIGNRYL